MKTSIYFFTGTGNSYVTARKLAERIGSKEFVSIPAIMERAEVRPNPENDVIIVYPVYAFRMPKIVAKFIRKLKTKRRVFIVATMGGGCGNMYNVLARRFKWYGLNLVAGYSVFMPLNYINMFPYPDREKTKKQFSGHDRRMDYIAERIISGVKHFDPGLDFFSTYIHPGIFYALAYLFLSKMDKSYYTTNECDGCRICEKICPVGNISMKNEKPVWNGHCEQCVACINFCPITAIEYGKSTIGKKRYFHPEVNAGDIIKVNRKSKDK